MVWLLIGALNWERSPLLVELTHKSIKEIQQPKEMFGLFLMTVVFAFLWAVSDWMKETTDTKAYKTKDKTVNTQQSKPEETKNDN